MNVDGESDRVAEMLMREREDQMFCILDVKKSKNVLHCIIVLLWCGGF